MAPGSRMYHPYLYGPSCGMALGHQHGPKWLIRSWATTWPLVTTGAMDIHSDAGCCRTRNSDMALGSILGMDTTWPRVASRPLPSTYSSPPSLLPFCLSSQHMNHSTSLPFLHRTFVPHNGTLLPVGAHGCFPSAGVLAG